MSEYKDLVTDEYLKPCPHCGFEKPHIRQYAAEDIGFFSKYAVICDYRDGGCGAESGHYNNKIEAISNWNSRITEAESVSMDTTKQRVRNDLYDFVTHQLKACVDTDTSSINYLDVANNIKSYDDRWCDRNKEIDITPEIDSIVNQIMEQLFAKAKEDSE